MAHNKKQ